MDEAYFLDASVLSLAAGDAHPLRGPCRELLTRGSQGQVRLHASVEAVQEFRFHRLRRVGREVTLSDSRRVAVSLTLHPFDLGVLEASFRVMELGSVRGRDALHAATAVLAGFTTIVSADRDLDGVPGLRRLDPSELDLTG